MIFNLLCAKPNRAWWCWLGLYARVSSKMKLFPCQISTQPNQLRCLGEVVFTHDESDMVVLACLTQASQDYGLPSKTFPIRHGLPEVCDDTQLVCGSSEPFDMWSPFQWMQSNWKGKSKDHWNLSPKCRLHSLYVSIYHRSRTKKLCVAASCVPLFCVFFHVGSRVTNGTNVFLGDDYTRGSCVAVECTVQQDVFLMHLHSRYSKREVAISWSCVSIGCL